MKELVRPKIGLALGSGGAKGFAHIGAIKALEANNIPIDFIAGSSIGALVGGFYAAGLTTARLEELALATNWRSMFSLVDPNLKLGLIGGNKVKAFIEAQIGQIKIENCQLPFAAVATDLNTGEVVTFNHGLLAEAIRASVSIPLVFKPVTIGSQHLADGGLSAPVPVETVRAMGAEIIIAVNLDQHFYEETWKLKWIDIANNSLEILRHHLALANTATADFVINIDSNQSYWYQFATGQSNIAVGEQATAAIIAELQTKIQAKTPTGLQKYFKFFRP